MTSVSTRVWSDGVPVLARRDGTVEGPAHPTVSTPPIAKEARWRGADYANIALLALAWIAAIVVVDPRGEFPTVDDWAWAASVRNLVEGGTLKFSDWSAGNLITHVLWGSLSSWIFGTSFLSLRGAMLVMGFAGGVALYGWLRLLPVRPAMALLGAACLLFNPIYFFLSFTFMTDVTYAALQTLAMWLVSHGLVSGAGAPAAWGWGVAIAALLCRQTGMAIPLGYAGAHVQRHGWSFGSILLALAPIVAFYAIQQGYVGWLASTDRLPLQYGFQTDSILIRLRGPIGVTVREAILLLGCAFFYLGLFTLPVSLVVMADELSRLAPRLRRRMLAAFAAFSIPVTIAIIIVVRPMPIWEDTITEWGLGRDAVGPWATPVYRYVATFLAALGGTIGTTLIGMRLWTFLTDRSDRTMTALKLFAAMTFAALLAPILFIIERFDRYFIPMIPCLIVLFLARSGLGARLGAVALPVRATAWLLVALSAAFSVVATHDHLATKRAHAAALDHIVAQGVPRDQIDAGWVFNGWHLHGKVGNPRFLSTWHNEPLYLVNIDFAPGYDVVAQFPVNRWLPWATKPEPVMLLRRRPDHPNVYGPRQPHEAWREWEEFVRARGK
jgi:hypothetical protein